MGKINILTPNIYNRIAAGEVVDRPYSVVKELVENSLDAGATEIEIRIENSGKSSICVIDDGNGIEKDDLHSVYLPHATSKISKAEDLEKIMTLGFRGEAVASIASVSHMRYISKTEKGECYSITCDGGKLGEVEEYAGAKGTQVTVNDLFYNTPVRLKFLKSDKGEETEITSYVAKFILGNPTVKFKYYADNKLILQSFGEGMEEALASVYGSSILQNTFLVDTQKNGITICGYIGNQNFFKPNRTYQSVFLNGRFIQNVTIASALTNAYASYMMKRQYPFYVLYLTVSPEVVDVNVHPNKSDVRFASNQVVYGSIYSVISAILDGSAKALEYIATGKEDKINSTTIQEKPIIKGSVFPKRPSEYTPKPSAFEKKDSVFGFTYEQAKKELEQNIPKRPNENIKLPFSEVDKNNFENDKEDSQKEEAIKITSTIQPQGNYDDLPFENNKLEVDKNTQPPVYDAYEENKKFLDSLEVKKKANKIDTSSCVYKGNLFNTFLIYELGDNAYLIDQHAAHERLIFDRLQKEMENRNIVQQPMLVPYILNVNAFESDFLRENLSVLQEIGFDIEEFGMNSFKVSAVPIDLQNIQLNEFFEDVLADISGLKAIKLKNLLKDKLAMTACKAAIKGGMDLTEQEIQSLFSLMDGDMGLKCPHGRPVVVKLSKQEIEKMFKRIV